MRKHDWITSVLKDIADYAEQNHLQILAEQVKQTGRVAEAEIALFAQIRPRNRIGLEMVRGDSGPTHHQALGRDEMARVEQFTGQKAD